MAWFLACLLLLLGLPIQAETVRSKHTTAELVSEVAAVQPGQSFTVALRLKHDPGWHSYWQNPGDSGLATTIRWALPLGMTAGPILWPYPELISTPPLATYGYEDEVLLLTNFKAPAGLKPGTSLTITAKTEWLECKEECLPGFATLNLEIPIQTSTAPSSWAEPISQSRAKLPLVGSEWQLRAALSEDNLILQGTPPAWFTGDLERVQFFPIQPLLVDAPAPQTLTRTEKGFVLTVPRAKERTSPTDLAGVLVNPQGWRGLNSERALAVQVPFEPVSNLPGAGGLNFWSALGLAMIGGLLLNLMPCVLPVLSIKVLGLVRQSGPSWHHGGAFTAGVLISCWILAGGLLLLRAGGEQLGWGFQLQSPGFVATLVAVLFLFGLNLFGVFEVGTSLSRVGEVVPSTGLAGSFGSGVLATVVATPCSAPYMGAALGFALTQPMPVALAIFTALGVGMALPYALLTTAPGLLKFVPKPGAWMVRFKQVMGFLMMGSVIWLLWVLGLQTSVNALARVLAALLLLGWGAWVLGQWGDLMQPSRTRWVARGIALGALVGGLVLALGDLATSAATPTPQKLGQLEWQVFSAERVAQLRQAGTPVFLDFTAAWCLSCQVNERVTFTEEVRTAFKQGGVVLMKADWTKRDPQITQALAQFGRSGVPLYVLYGSKQTTQVLPEVLTPDLLLKALGDLKG